MVGATAPLERSASTRFVRLDLRPVHRRPPGAQPSRSDGRRDGPHPSSDPHPHPDQVHNPLAQMVETLRATDASLVYAMVHPHAERYNRNPSPSPNPTLCQTLTLCQALALTPTQVQLLAASGRPLRRAHLSSH